LRNDAPVAQVVEDALADIELDLSVMNGSRPKVDLHYRGRAIALDMFVADGEGAVGSLHSAVREISAAKGAKQVENKDSDENQPDATLEPPPAALEVKILSNGDFVVHFGDGVANGSGRGGRDSFAWPLQSSFFFGFDDADFPVAFEHGILDAIEAFDLFIAGRGHHVIIEDMHPA
jgi:hypothetical protein